MNQNNQPFIYDLSPGIELNRWSSVFITLSSSKINISVNGNQNIFDIPAYDNPNLLGDTNYFLYSYNTKINLNKSDIYYVPFSGYIHNFMTFQPSMHLKNLNKLKTYLTYNLPPILPLDYTINNLVNLISKPDIQIPLTMNPNKISNDIIVTYDSINDSPKFTPFGVSFNSWWRGWVNYNENVTPISNISIPAKSVYNVTISFNIYPIAFDSPEPDPENIKIFNNSILAQGKAIDNSSFGVGWILCFVPNIGLYFKLIIIYFL
jgi:hypothetical protein